MNPKIQSLDEMAKVAEALRAEGKTLVQASGVFVLNHIGHIRYLRYAKSLGDVLVVSINSDESLKEVRRGKNHFYVNQQDRAETLAALDMVDYVTIFDELDASNAVRAIRPHTFVKGADYAGRVKEQAALREAGGTLVISRTEKLWSSGDFLCDLAAEAGRARQLLRVGEQFNYIGCFLTLRCTYTCWFCINRSRLFKPRAEISGAKWITFFNRLATDIPVTLQGGEPTLHADFYDIINNTIHPLELMTNLSFDLDRFMKRVPPDRFRRTAPFAPIRSTFYPEQEDPVDFIAKVKRLTDAGYDVCSYVIEMPRDNDRLARWRDTFEQAGLELRVKAYLGMHKGRLYPEGGYADEQAVQGDQLRPVRCRTNDILVAPDGLLHRCHRDLYAGENAIATLINPEEALAFTHRECNNFGGCNYCDLKIKNNRFEQPGFVSVDILSNEKEEPREE